VDLLINADARQIPLADCSVNCIVTSPPYYGLRDYGTARWEGGDPDCDHLGKLMPTRTGFNERYFDRPSSENNKQDAVHEPMGQVCTKCGAIRIDQQIGLEQTPDAYIANLVAVFRECKRILRDDGTLWVNIGDSYFSDTKGTGGPSQKQDSNAGSRYNPIKLERTNGVKPKDLIGIPWMLAFALRADGWYLRQDIIWAKPNPMPESVKDRCTKSHEYIFLLSKSPNYYYDYEAIKEPVSNMGKPRAFSKPGNKDRNDVGRIYNPSETHNKRSVWTVSVKPYRGTHFATYPPKLIEPCILAGCPMGGIVFDPFVGSGTTVAVANSLGRMGIGIDLNYNYLLLARKRIERVQLPLLLV